jgi:hypothetical protein
MNTPFVRASAVCLLLLAIAAHEAGAASAGASADSRRMARAKDLIADEQWGRAVEELRAAADDPKERAKAEALFWLAHSLNQEHEFVAAVEVIRRLEREHRASPWVRPARSLLIELAQKLRREDVLWWTAAPPAAPAEPAPAPDPGPRNRPPAPRAAGKPAPREAVPPPNPWVAGSWHPDTDQRILALGTLIHTDAKKVIPMLRHIALEPQNPGAARRAVFVLAQSRQPEALSTVVEVATRGPEPVKLAAVRGLGGFRGPEASRALLDVYASGNVRVKRQVVTTLGERAETTALLRIAQSESDRALRSTAIVTLGRAGGRAQLAALYPRADREGKRRIINALFTAGADKELLAIVAAEADPQLRADASAKLKLLGKGFK